MIDWKKGREEKDETGKVAKGQIWKVLFIL
jgi:hypothetical protein